jgi:hypothetical protein
LGKHLENPLQLYNGLFFLRKDNDDSRGGSLEFYYDPKGQKKLESHSSWGSRAVKNEQLNKIITIPYQRNCFVLFINSNDAINGFTDLEPTLHCRRIVRLVGRVSEHSIV